MKSDETTQSAGFAAVLGFNLRQFTRYLAGEVRPKYEEFMQNAANGLMVGQNQTLILHA